MITPKEVSEKVFDRTFGVGYRIDDVNSYLAHVANEIKHLLEINADLENKIEVLAEKLTEYREDEESLRTAILGAQKLGDSVIRESKTKAEIITRDATCKAEAMVNNARRQIEREQENLLRTQREVASFKNRLLDMYKSHIELISAIPGEIEEDEPVAAAPVSEPEQEIDESAFMPPREEEEVIEQPVEEGNEQIEFLPAEEEKQEPTIESLFDLDEPDEEDGFGPDDASDDDDDDDDDTDDDDEAEEQPHSSRFSDIDMKFGDAFRIKRNSKPKFRK